MPINLLQVLLPSVTSVLPVSTTATAMLRLSTEVDSTSNLALGAPMEDSALTCSETSCRDSPQSLNTWRLGCKHQ